ncbi:MAG: UvrD-helicase domain-containing protein, partial [Gammaproteobacteria bacterium]
FIVQAPAGSGKTELLTQRFLQVLAGVDAPEEILAVTFTRKAAAEMRRRIISSIFPPPGKDNRRKQTKALAEAVYARDQELGWNLRKYPARLRIRTIDSVNAWLSSTAPIFGQASGAVSGTPFDLYREAAMRTIQQVTETGLDADALRNLLQHLDNRTHTLIGLLTRMLAKRDQWLPFVFDIGRSDVVRKELEDTLGELVALELKAAEGCIPGEWRNRAVELLRFAGSNLISKHEEWELAEQLTEFPQPIADELPAWRLIAELLLTKGGEVRKSVDVRSGFPPGEGENAVRKQQVRELFDAVRDTTNAAELLKPLRNLPEPSYSDQQWELLKDLLEVLHLAAGELLLVFAEQGEADYPAIAQNALQALEDEDGPTDMSLRLDYLIRHILIDEFQDTSSAQLELLKALTAGWSSGDGRTLFLVGDPMQSIYRFRKAEVGLFLDLQDQAIEGAADTAIEPVLPNVELHKLSLKTNFRSDSRVVNWVNKVFEQVMPEKGDRTSGAVSYAESSAAREDEPDAEVRLHPLLKPSRTTEALQVAELIEQTLLDHPPDMSEPEEANTSIGVLVRAKAHAALIAQCLREKGIRFSGTGLENSVDTQVVQDLLCLTRALTHLGDRTAWLGLLRGPWCGLTLIDLEALVGGRAGTVWGLLSDETAYARLSADGRTRVQRLIDVLKPVFSQRGALPLRDIVEGVWVQLGGPAFLSVQDGACPDLLRAQAFFDVLDSVDTGGDNADAFHLHELIADQLAIEDTGAPVNLLTIHKSKGLEFDTVILPALEVTPPAPDKPPLAWQEVVRPNGEPGLVIAPVESIGDERDPVFDLARRLNSAQDSNEKDRLLYVAATRARVRLHLFYGLGIDKKTGELKEPAKNSLIGRLWSALDESRMVVANVETALKEPEEWLQPVISRCRTSWRVPAAPAPCDIRINRPDNRYREVSYDWAGSAAMHVGSVTHRWLQLIAEQGIDNFNDARINALRPVFRSMLAELDVIDGELDDAVGKVVDGLTNTLRDSTGQWLLSTELSDAVCEYPVTVMRDNRIESMVIDRTFVDADGVRWIIDYKASTHEGGGLETFIEEQKRRYSEQLEGYRYAMQLLEPDREIKTALYFPLLGRLHVVEANL